MAKEKSLKRTHRVTFVLNDKEKELLDLYKRKYKVENASRFMREAVVRAMLKQLDLDRPTLFD